MQAFGYEQHTLARNSNAHINSKRPSTPSATECECSGSLGLLGNTGSRSAQTAISRNQRVKNVTVISRSARPSTPSTTECECSVAWVSWAPPALCLNPSSATECECSAAGFLGMFIQRGYLYTQKALETHSYDIQFRQLWLSHPGATHHHQISRQHLCQHSSWRYRENQQRRLYN